NVAELPRSLAVVGAGVIGLEYASIFAALGVRVTLIDTHPQILPFIDRELIDALTYQMRDNRVTFYLGETVSRIEPIDDEHGRRVRIHLASGKQTIAERALYSVGRRGAVDDLNLGAAGLAADARGRLSVNEHHQTSVPHLYAVGDVIGFPSLASTSMEQGRGAAGPPLGGAPPTPPPPLPHGVFTLPRPTTG